MLSVIRQTRASLSFLTLYALILSSFAFVAQAQTAPKRAAKLTEEQKILHVLNRLGFGARPSDVEKVRSIGLDKYIEQQLNASSVDDSAAEARLKSFEVLEMSNAEIFAKFPNPAAILTSIARKEGVSRADLQQARSKKADGLPENAMNREKMNDGATMPNPADMTEAQRREYRQKVAEIMRENGLRRPGEITQQLTASRIVRAAYSERQLQEAMVDFWTNHFNVFTNKGAVRWYLPQYDRDVIRPNALGNFRDLLTATAKSPAMLFYLDNFESVAPNQANNDGNGQLQRAARGELNERQLARLRERTGLSDEQIKQRAQQMQNRRKRGINENYAREIMELHTLGVDGGYTQNDIKEVARAFTGWTIVDPRGYSKVSIGAKDDGNEQMRERMRRNGGFPVKAEAGTFYFNERLHDKGEKVVLGQKINYGNIKDGEKVIELLVGHPSTAKFIARKLAVKFVNDNPSETLVNRVAEAFQKSQGDIKTTLRALFNSPEFFAPENYRAKIKTPFELAVSAIRAVDADTNGGQIQAMVAKMGEPLYGYQAPTGYPDTAEDWVNTGALLERMNFAVALASNRIRGTRTELTKLAPNAERKNSVALLDTYLQAILHGEATATTRNSLVKQLDKPLVEPQLADNDSESKMMPVMSGKRPKGQRGRMNQLLPPSGDTETFKIVGLILGSPDFQRQ